jgi:hypothetical protein
MKNPKPIWRWFLYTLGLLLTVVFILFLAPHYKEIPTFKKHRFRNKHNILLAGRLKLVKGPYYVDDNNITWKKRTFLQSIFHNPLKNYTFETVNSKKVSSSEAVILKSDFDRGRMRFKNGSFNYYSSYTHPVSHFFADVLPIALYFIWERNN